VKIKIFISVLFFVFNFYNSNAQTYNYSYTDPCTGNVKNIIVPINGSVTVGYYGFIENFTQQDFVDGTFESWANNVFSQFDGSPCSEIVGLTGSINIAQDVALNTVGLINSLSALMDISNGATDFLSGTLTAASNSSNSSSKANDKKNNKKNGNNSQNGSGNNITNNTTTNNTTTTNNNNSTTNNNQNQINGTSNNNEGSATTTGTNETSSNNGTNGTSSTNVGNETSTQAGGTTTQSGTNENGNSQTNQSINNQNNNTNQNNGNTNTSGNIGGNNGNGSSGNGEGTNEQGKEITNPSPTNNTKTNENTNVNSNSQGNGGNTPNGEETTTQTEEQGGGQTNITQGATKTINQNKEGGKPTVIASSDFVGFNFQNSEVTTGLKLTGGYHNMRWDGQTARGGLLDYVSAQRGPNLTGYHAWINKKSMGLLSGTVSLGFEGRGSLYGTLAGGQMFMFPKVPGLKAVYMGTVSYGQVYKTSFLGTALIGGGMYDLKFGRRFDVKLMGLFVYSPYVSYYNDLVLKSPYVILPSIGTNIAITKRFKFNINGGGAWAIKVNTLNYTITCGTRLLIGQ
jgi:hypothetical protein